MNCMECLEREEGRDRESRQREERRGRKREGGREREERRGRKREGKVYQPRECQIDVCLCSSKPPSISTYPFKSTVPPAKPTLASVRGLS